MRIMQESIKSVCGVWSLITLGIIENLRKIKASRVVLLLGAPDRASIILILQRCGNVKNRNCYSITNYLPPTFFVKLSDETSLLDRVHYYIFN